MSFSRLNAKHRKALRLSPLRCCNLKLDSAISLGIFKSHGRRPNWSAQGLFALAVDHAEGRRVAPAEYRVVQHNIIEGVQEIGREKERSAIRYK